MKKSMRRWSKAVEKQLATYSDEALIDYAGTAVCHQLVNGWDWYPHLRAAARVIRRRAKQRRRAA